jgi:SAM-dependent methyltransferase
MNQYYHHIRSEIRPLLPKACARILDVGAGTGGTLRWLKTLYPDAETTGVELKSALERDLSANVDVPIIGSIEESLPLLKNYDLILLLDVLEHLVDSVGTLKKIVRHLNPTGHVIVSVPNVAHLSVSLPLLLQRRFDYQDAGILDRTHFHFFYDNTALSLMNDANLLVTSGVTTGLEGPKAKFLNFLSLGFLRHHLTKQYIMLGEPAVGNLDQKPVHWIAA